MALVKLPSVQTWLVARVTNYLSDELNTTVRVDAVDLVLFRSLKLKGLYVEDLQHDTLLYAPEITATITSFKYKEKKMVISVAAIDQARIKLKRYADTPGLNFQFLADYFSGSAPDSTGKPWDVKLKKIKLSNATFSYRDLRWNDTTPCVDYEDIFVSNLNLQMDDLTPKGDSLLFDLNNLHAEEKSGFKVSSMSGKMLISPRDLAIDKMTLITPYSNVKGDVHLKFTSWEEFDDFNRNIRIESSLASSKVASEDVKYFAKELWGLNKTITFKGNVKGTVSNLKGHNLEVIYTPQCYFKGDVAMNGLPDFDETFIDLMAKDLTLNKKDLETINTYPFNENKKIELPSNVSELGVVKFKGKFTGFYTDFVAYGDANTAIGFFSSDVNLKLGDSTKQAAYSGTLVTHKFNIGKLLGLDPEVGEITSKVKIQGHSLALQKLNTNLDGTISQLTIKGYNYSGITVNGHVERKLFKGSLLVKDENADLDFIGTIDYSQKKPVFDFSADLRKAKLGILNLVKRDASSNLSTKAEMHFIGSKIDEMEGTLHFSNTGYTEFPRGIAINNLWLKSTLADRNRSIVLESDFADASIVGDFQLSSIVRSAMTVLSRYIPSVPVPASKSPVQNQDFRYAVSMKETRGVLDVLIPDLSITAGTKLEGTFNASADEFTTTLTSDEIIYQGIRFGGISIDGNTNHNALNISATNAELQVNDSLVFRNVKIEGQTSRDSADLKLIVSNTDSSLSRINWDFDIHFMNTGYTTVKLLTNEFLLEKEFWHINPANFLLFDSTGVLFSQFEFNSGNQFIGFNGIAGTDTTAKLGVALRDFEIARLNTVLKIYKANIGGTANGNIAIASLLQKPVIQSDLEVKHFSWFGDTLGDAELKTEWNTNKGVIDVDGLITRGGEKNIAVNGVYIVKPKNDEIDFNITLQKTYIKTFSPYLRGIFSGLSGIASGNFRLYGLASEPLLTGEAHLQKVGFTVDYLNTSYSFSTDVMLEEDEIVFDDVILFDSKGNKATASGTVTHDHLKDFYFDVNIKTNNTQLLNTSSRDNELFYGVGYGSGNINISGYLDYIKIDIAMRTEKGTQINIPLNNPEEISQSNFITFVQTDTVSKAADKEFELSGIELNMDFDVTTDASIKLIFDDKIGDVIEGKGTGTLTMKVNDADGFQMFGNYYIDQGQYTFTLQNVISKPFTIERGGTISWTGDPYDANVSINAVYSRLRVSLFDLLQDTTSSYNRPMPVVLRLKLREKLFNPIIGFDIEVPNIDAATAGRVERYINTEEEKFRQAVSLLVLRRFSPPDELANRPTQNTTSGVGQNAYEFFSRQVSAWASQINENVNVNVNYNPGSTLTPEEIELALATTILNERLTIEGNVGVANSNSGATQNTNNIAGDFSVEVKASKDGRVRLKAFNRSNVNSPINSLTSQYTQGIGVFYREEFNTIGDLTRRWRERFKSKKNSTPASGQALPD